MPFKTSAPVPKPTAPRLPPVPMLRVKRPNGPSKDGPCLGLLTTVLACFASTAGTPGACAALEEQLRVCMDTPRPKVNRKNSINYHLGRFHPQINGPMKRK